MAEKSTLDSMFEQNAKTERKAKAGSNGQGYAQDSPTTVNGYETSEVVSALQKAIRRGEEARALYWCSELLASNMSYRMWRRLVVIAAEDVGLADPDMVQRIMVMKQAHDFGRELNIPFLAVMLLTRAPKNREADDASYLYDERRKQGWKIPMPPEGVDGHTRTGKSRLYSMARQGGEDFLTLWCREFYYDAALLKNYQPDGDVEADKHDRWRRRLMKFLNLPFRTYDLDTCPEPRMLTGSARKTADAYQEEQIANRIPEEVDITNADPATGESTEGVYGVRSFTDPETVYRVDMNEGTCTCKAFENSGGVCKHQLAVMRRTK